MAIEGLTIIGESVNDSVPSTKKLFEANDIEGLKALVRKQDEGGAAYIDVNVGTRSAGFMAQMVGDIQSVTDKPLSIDTPDVELAAAGLEAYDPERTGGKRPILNSISVQRPEMFDLFKIQPFMPILLVSERLADGEARPCSTAEETYQAAKDMLRLARESGHDLPNDQCIIDPAIGPIGADTEGNTKRVLGVLRQIHEDPDFAGIHASVGLSNFTVMLPSKRADGSPVKGPLESAFLTLAMPLGLDMIVGSVVRKYALLSSEDPAMQCLQDFLEMDGFEGVMRVKDFYS
jgi:cobalamin-dependent methionine synthase I